MEGHKLIFPIYGKITNVPNHQPAKFNNMCITDYDGLIIYNKTLEKNIGLNQNNGFILGFIMDLSLIINGHYNGL
jgi:hypothetical protein